MLSAPKRLTNAASQLWRNVDAVDKLRNWASGRCLCGTGKWHALTVEALALDRGGRRGEDLALSSG